MPVLRDEPLDVLVLAAHTRGARSAPAISAALHPSLRGVTERRPLSQQILVRLEALHGREWLAGGRLTELGQAAIAQQFGLESLLDTRRWRAQLVVPGLGVGMAPALRRARLGQAGPLAAEILRQRMALDLPPLPDLDTVIESLGYGPARRAVRREVRALAAASVGVSVSRAAPLARGLLVRWVTTGKAIPGAERVPPKPVGFTEEVLLAARSSPTGRIGDAYVMISHAWRQLSERGSPLSLDHFKHELVTAHRQRGLSLKGADMPQLYDPSDLAESEVHYRGSRFHLIRI